MSSRLRIRGFRFLPVITASLLGLGTSDAANLPERVDFNFHVRPILSDKCFKCHGPDEASRKADLRLDNAEGAYAVLNKESGLRAIVPQHPSQSEVIRRVTTTDPEDLMPPPESKMEISSDEILILRRWIEQGAEYKSHWAFASVGDVSVPRTKSSNAKNLIDHFVMERLRREKLRPAAEASKETLIRRLSFDLTGLPPSVDDIDRFLKDRSMDAYDKLTDRLLASSAYGERMAVEWLDLARYADSYGYQSDADRDMSAWRDWVIHAFNSNLRYDDFIRWQLAGDLLPNATDEQILATAFNRLHRQTNEGGSIEEEFRTEYVADRVHTFGTAFLGLTLECARCHDHKYDPIKQRDYYSLSAFFNNIDESGLYSHFTQATPAPTLLLYGEGQKEKHAELKEQIAAAEKNLAKIAMQSNAGFTDWLKTNQHVDIPTAAAAFNFDNFEGNKTVSSIGDSHALAVENVPQVEGVKGKAVQFDGEGSVVCKGVGHFRRTDPFSFRLSIKRTQQSPRAVVFHHSRSWTDSGSRGYELVLENGRPTFALIHFWPGNAIAIRGRDMLPLNEWTQLTITYDGSSKASGLKMYRNGEPIDCETVRDHLTKDIIHRGEWGDSDVGNIDLTLAARFRDAGFKGGSIDDFEVFNSCLTALECSDGREKILASVTKDVSLVTSAATNVIAHFLERHDPTYRSAVDELKKLRETENHFVNDIREIMVMKEMAPRRQTFVLRRGSYDAPGEPVEPGTPERIFPFLADQPKNRLGLAAWLTDSRNPLTARVVVNRVWRNHFGRGLVSTPEDFGSQGQLPTHPELLDWLSKHFIESGWDLKALHKLIVTSATYRQSSDASAKLVARDPENQLLARGPRHRLAAEEIRDAALAASTLLSRQIGGPSVKPYQPAGLWEQSGIAKSYAQDTGERLYRRSMYTFWRRTAPPPSMLTFDATSREVCTAKRQVTATPLQPLVLLNDPQFVEAARVLAERIFTENSDLETCIDTAFRQVLGRNAERRERDIVRQLFDEQLQFFAQSRESAEKFLAVGEKARSETLAPEKAAAATVMVSALMNHDEFVTKR
jgi:hypothetical protein